jgi:hypothetical protein
VLGDSSVKIKDIVVEGLASSFGKALLPSQLQKTLQTLKQTKRPLDPAERTKLEPDELELAKASHEKYGDNPESSLPGALGWLTPQQQKALVDAKEKELRRKERQQAQTKQTKGKRRLARDVFGDPAQPAPAQPAPAQPAPARPAAAQPAPAQVRLPSGQYVTKYGNSWYDETGARIAIPGDVERLERMARGPSGQSQMATTKNTPVDLPGYTRKKK